MQSIAPIPGSNDGKPMNLTSDQMGVDADVISLFTLNKIIFIEFYAY